MPACNSWRHSAAAGLQRNYLRRKTFRNDRNVWRKPATRCGTKERMQLNFISRRTLLAGAAVSAFQSTALTPADDPLHWTLNQAAHALATGKISSEELTNLCLARMQKFQPRLNAVITLLEDAAVLQAQKRS